MMGRRSERLAEASPRRFCITKLVTVIRLTGLPVKKCWQGEKVSV
jgi:hypothetical protein